jgi:hypothetical protein
LTALRDFLVRWPVPLERSIEEAVEEGQTTRKYLRGGEDHRTLGIGPRCFRSLWLSAKTGGGELYRQTGGPLRELDT